MAKVINPLLSTEARGRFGGNVYNSWRGINYVKGHTSPSQPQTVKQLAIRSLFQAASIAWQGLSDANRATWETYADQHLLPDWTGTPKRLTGMNWYVHLWISMTRLGETPVDTAPEVPAPDPLTGFNLALSTGDITMTWTAPTTATLHLEVWTQGPHSPGQQGSLRRARFLVYQAADGTPPITIVTGAAAGRWSAWARIVDEDTGLESTWQLDTVDVT